MILRKFLSFHTFKGYLPLSGEETIPDFNHATFFQFGLFRMDGYPTHPDTRWELTPLDIVSLKNFLLRRVVKIMKQEITYILMFYV